MDKILTIKFLINEVELENIKINTYDEEYERAKIQYPEFIPWEWFKNHPRGSKSKIKEYLKTIRRLTLEIEKEM